MKHVKNFYPALKGEVCRSFYQDIVEKDVLTRFGIRRKDTFREFAKYLASNIAGEFTLSKLTHIFELRDVHTVRGWLGALESAYLYYIVDRFSPKLKQSVIAPKKLYSTDNGIAVAISPKEEEFGRLMENLVAIELLRRANYWGAPRFHYWKDYTQHEVDFVLEDGKRVGQLIQVSYVSSEREIERRELLSLLKASHTLNCNNLLLITWDYEGTLSVEGKTIKSTPPLEMAPPTTTVRQDTLSTQ